MDLYSIAIYVIIFLMGAFVASIKDIGKEIACRVFRMSVSFIKQILIELGIYNGDFPVTIE
jgi:hypothetical protein